MALRKCPVCKAGVIRRQDQRTCGGSDCLRFWKEMTSSERFKLEMEAEKPFFIPPPTSQPIKPLEPVEDEPIMESGMPTALRDVIGLTDATTEICEEHGKAMCFICSGLIKPLTEQA